MIANHKQRITVYCKARVCKQQCMKSAVSSPINIRIPCGTKFLRVLIFAFFAGFFHDRQKKGSREKKFPQKFYPQIFTPYSKLYTNIAFYT